MPFEGEGYGGAGGRKQQDRRPKSCLQDFKSDGVDRISPQGLFVEVGSTCIGLGEPSSFRNHFEICVPSSTPVCDKDHRHTRIFAVAFRRI